VYAEYSPGNSSGAVAVKFANAEFPSETGAAVKHSVSYMLEYYLQPAGSGMLSDYELRNTVQEYQWIKVKPSNMSFPHCNKPIPSHEYYSSGHERSCGLDSHWNTRSQTYEPPEPERNGSLGSYFVGGDVNQRVHTARVDIPTLKKGDHVHFRLKVWNSETSPECESQLIGTGGDLWPLWVTSSHHFQGGEVNMAVDTSLQLMQTPGQPKMLRGDYELVRGFSDSTSRYSPGDGRLVYMWTQPDLVGSQQDEVIRIEVRDISTGATQEFTNADLIATGNIVEYSAYYDRMVVVLDNSKVPAKINPVTGLNHVLELLSSNQYQIRVRYDNHVSRGEYSPWSGVADGEGYPLSPPVALQSVAAPQLQLHGMNYAVGVNISWSCYDPYRRLNAEDGDDFAIQE
jgi:hypothetical protein